MRIFQVILAVAGCAVLAGEDAPVKPPQAPAEEPAERPKPAKAPKKKASEPAAKDVKKPEDPGLKARSEYVDAQLKALAKSGVWALLKYDQQVQARILAGKVQRGEVTGITINQYLSAPRELQRIWDLFPDLIEGAAEPAEPERRKRGK